MTSMMFVSVSVEPVFHSLFAVMGRDVSANEITSLNCAPMTPPYSLPISQPPWGGRGERFASGCKGVGS